MDIRVLGSLEVIDDGIAVELSSRRLRRLLAVLVVHANEVVSADRLIDLVWGDAEPLGGAWTLKTNVSRLRSVLEPGRLHGESNRVVTRPPGYQLSLAADELDAGRFDRLVAEAARLVAEGDRSRRGDPTRRGARIVARPRPCGVRRRGVGEARRDATGRTTSCRVWKTASTRVSPAGYTSTRSASWRT